MTARTTYLWRVIAYYPGTIERRDYHSLRAANERADRLRAPRADGGAGPTLVEVTRSDPVTWPAP